MKCAQARKLFGPYWDDEITQAEREWLEAHMNTCASCRTGYDAFARSLELVTTLPREEAAPDLVERALARSRRLAPAPDLLPESSPRWVPAAAAVAAVTVVALLVLPRAGLLPRSPEPPLVSQAETEPVAVPERVASAETKATVGPEGGRIAVAELFDHDEDVEFVLDPVALRRGRAHPLPQSSSRQDVQVERAVISF